ncbi:MAG TPA: SMP-30/gluconolactonase/LRE family protein [Polyangia bacterium]|jgi:gluconolactonase|nr:SMP-30/gluconolactonase/LRE family protein [Polyangia bacterium]
MSFRLFCRPIVRFVPATVTVLVMAVLGCSSSSTPNNNNNSPDGGGNTAVTSLGTATAITQSTYNFISLEGPYWVASGNYLIFSDVVEKNMTGSLIYKYDPATSAFSVYPYPTAMPADTNGLGMDSKGQLVATERYNHQVTRVEGGSLKVLASTYPATGGKALNAPNDVVVDSHDNIYFSDTRWGSMYADADLVPNAAYRIAPDGSLSQVYVAGTDPTMTSVNGIAVSLDGMALYLGDDIANKLWKLPLAADGSVPAGAMPTLLADSSKLPGNKFLVPDGINIDDSGNIYVALNHHDVNAIAVLKPDGTLVGKYDVPVGIDPSPDGGAPLDPGGRGPSNITFGGADRKTLFITTLHGIYQVAVPTPGKP